MAPPRTEPRPGGSHSTASRPAAAIGFATPAQPGQPSVAIAVLAVVSAVFVWWALKQGAFFGSVFLPGTIVLDGLLVLLLAVGPFRGRLAGPPRIALIALLALAGWTLLSIIWTSSNAWAVQDAERTLLYAAAFMLGLWSTNLAGRRLLLPLAAIAALGAIVGVIVTLTLATGTDVSSYVHGDATLRFPIGYRNAEAAFLLICLWPTIVLAAEGTDAWPLRALLLGSATMLLELAVLAESRGSLPAAAVGLAVFLVLTPRRLRATTYLALAAAPVLPALPTLLDVFQHGSGGPGLIPLLHDAARVIALTSLGSVALAAACIRGIEFRLNLGRRRVQILSWGIAIVAIAVVAIGGTAFVSSRGGPISFVDQRVSEFKKVGYPDLSSQGTRFGANIGSNRHDFWRVSIDEGVDNPITGGGAGSFATNYLQRRRSGESPKDPHSVEALMFGELGFVGFALFVTFVAAAALAGIRSRRRGRGAVLLTAGALAAGANWVFHASYDWFWRYPAITAPAVFLLGAAAAPSLVGSELAAAKVARRIAIAVLATAIVLAVPLFLSQRYANRAYGEWPGDAAAALDDLNRAASLNPYDPDPLLAKGVIAAKLGQPAAAATAFRQASDRQPDDYAAHYFLARTLAGRDRSAARAEATEALRLNPLEPTVRQLARRLGSRGS